MDEADWERLPEDWPASRRIGFRAAAGLRLACAGHHHWTSRPRRWELRELAEAAELTIDLLDFGAPADQLRPRTGPPEVRATTTVPLATIADLELSAEDGRSPADALAPDRAWGVALTLRRPAGTMLGADAASDRITLGPYAPDQREWLDEVCREGGDDLWCLHQFDGLAAEAVQVELGGTPEQLADAYLTEWLARDVDQGAAARGTSLDDSDAGFRARYIELARRCRRGGDPQRAAAFASAALQTLQPDDLLHHAPGYTLVTRLPVAGDLRLAPSGDGAPLPRGRQAQAIMEEFSDLAGLWQTVEAKRTVERQRLGDTTDEGGAVWREFAFEYLLRHGMIRSLADRIGAPANVVARYADEPPSNLYVRGFDLVTRAAEQTSVWLFASRPLGHALLWQPLRLFEQRLAVHDLAALPETHYAGPNQRLARLAGSASPKGSRGWVDAVYQLLDRNQQGLVATVEQVLSRHEKDVR